MKVGIAGDERDAQWNASSYELPRSLRTFAENVRAGRRISYVEVVARDFAIHTALHSPTTPPHLLIASGSDSALCLAGTPTDLNLLLMDRDAAVESPDSAGPLDGAVYAELKRLASRHLRVHAAGATVSTTDLVHEAYLKFGASGDRTWNSRAHYFGSASRAMRQVLVDYARNRQASKRGGGQRAVTLTGGAPAPDARLDEILVLDEALERLRALDDRLCRVVELRYFAGLDDAEIAECLGVTLRTVGRDWVKARLFLARELGHD